MKGTHSSGTSAGGLGGPAILPLSLAKMSQLTREFPDKAFSGIGGIANFEHALNYFLLGCGTVQVCTAAMLDHAIGPNVIKTLMEGMSAFMDAKGFKSLEDFRGARRDRIVPHSQIKRPDAKEYHGGYEDEVIEGVCKAGESSNGLVACTYGKQGSALRRLDGGRSGTALCLVE